MIFFGLDIGSSGCKCAAFTEDGRLVSENAVEYLKSGGVRGIDPNVLYADVCRTVAGCSSKINLHGQKAALAVSSFGESFAAFDKDGNALSEIVMYTETGCEEETRRLSEILPDLPYITGAGPAAMYALPKMSLMMQNRPEVNKKAARFFQVADYIIFKLCGEAAIDYSLASRALAFDIKNKKWSEKILHTAGLGGVKLSEPVPSGTVVGIIKKSAAEAAGLPPGTLIAAGAHDQIAAAVGAGVISPGEAAVGTGSVECITPVFDRPVTEHKNTFGVSSFKMFTENNYACVPFAEDGCYATYAFTMSGGALVKWFKNLTGRGSYALFDRNMPSAVTDVIAVPFFLGTGTPEMNPDMFGTISGMTISTTKYEIYRAILEGLSFELRHNREILAECGINFCSLRAAGGGAKSAKWLQIKADILGVPITGLTTTETGAMGGAMLAAVKTGAFSSLKEAAECFVKTKKTYSPNLKTKEIYEKKYLKYLKERNKLFSQ